MNDSSDLVDYIKEARMVLDDTIETLLNLKGDALCEKDEAIIPISNVVELVDMSYGISDSEKIKSAESEFLKRQAI
ncbi:MAG: hypothetical protein ACT4NT_01330 [Nitrososphaerota archaeon]